MNGDSSMTEPVHRPTDVEALQEIVRRATGGLRIVGGDTKSALGSRAPTEATIDMTGLAGIVTYEPSELILIARPGTALAEVEELLAAEGQHLAFEPPHWGATATLGGTVACGLSGPRRFIAGALRDFVLGAQIVDGHGQCVRSGGRVVKNVTGYDVPRLLCGSFGTLGILTEVCLKLWPRPEQELTLIIHDQVRQTALDALLQWARFPFEITGLAYQPDDRQRGARTLLRLEGAERAVAQQSASVRETLGTATGSGTQVEIVEGSASAAIWCQVREQPVTSSEGSRRWRYTVPRTRASELIDELSELGLQQFLVDWAGGLVWATLPETADPLSLHALATDRGGSAWRLAGGPDDANRDAFTPMDPVLERLNRTLKTSMDPHGLLNPGRMLPVAG